MSKLHDATVALLDRRPRALSQIAEASRAPVKQWHYFFLLSPGVEMYFPAHS
jgi:hypothetical protein